MPTNHNSQVLFVHLQDMGQQHKLIPDYLTWSQCFAIFTAVLGMDQPNIIQELMAYQLEIAKYVKKYKWPSWSFTTPTSGSMLRIHPASHGLPSNQGYIPSVSPTCQKTLTMFGANTVSHWTMPQHSALLCLHSKRSPERQTRT